MKRDSGEWKVDEGRDKGVRSERKGKRYEVRVVEKLRVLGGG